MASSGWQVATITATQHVSARVKLFQLALESPISFAAGQHVDIRLTAPDGYQAQRSYSISSRPNSQEELELAIEKISNGEVSSYLHEYCSVGTQVEVRGPIGGPFILKSGFEEPVLFIAGGIGIAPLMSMLRLREYNDNLENSALLYSTRMLDDLVFSDELFKMADRNGLLFIPTLTRESPADWNKRADNQTGRFDQSNLKNLLEHHISTPKLSFICGGTQFVESLSVALVDAGCDPETIRTERFGP
ncbi:MAG: FAD-binding oxidoreductase [Dehalococcoidia bacterium]